MRWVLLLALWLSGCSAVKMHGKWLGKKATRNGFESAVMEDGPHRVHHWVAGTGPTVVLIHGFGGNGLWTWWTQARTLAHTHRVIIPDLLWFGESTSDAPPTLDAQAEAIDALVRHLVPDNERVDVAGISYGGLVALRYGNLAPNRQGKLVMVDSPGPMFTRQDELAMLNRYQVATVEELFVPTSTDQVSSLVRLAYHKPPPLPAWLLKDLKTHVFSRNQDEQRALLNDLQANRAHYQKNETAPYEKILVVWGEFDQVFPLAIGQRLAEYLGAELFVVENTGHAPNLEKPRPINQKLNSFLKP